MAVLENKAIAQQFLELENFPEYEPPVKQIAMETSAPQALMAAITMGVKDSFVGSVIQWSTQKLADIQSKIKGGKILEPKELKERYGIQSKSSLSEDAANLIFEDKQSRKNLDAVVNSYTAAGGSKALPIIGNFLGFGADFVLPYGILGKVSVYAGKFVGLAKRASIVSGGAAGEALIGYGFSYMEQKGSILRGEKQEHSVAEDLAVSALAGMIGGGVAAFMTRGASKTLALAKADSEVKNALEAIPIPTKAEPKMIEAAKTKLIGWEGAKATEQKQVMKSMVAESLTGEKNMFIPKDKVDTVDSLLKTLDDYHFEAKRTGSLDIFPAKKKVITKDKKILLENIADIIKPFKEKFGIKFDLSGNYDRLDLDEGIFTQNIKTGRGTVALQNYKLFKDNDSYFKVLLHELAHAQGSKRGSKLFDYKKYVHRRNRFVEVFGEQEIPRIIEESIAETTSQLLMSRLFGDIPDFDNIIMFSLYGGSKSKLEMPIKQARAATKEILKVAKPYIEESISVLEPVLREGIDKIDRMQHKQFKTQLKAAIMVGILLNANNIKTTLGGEGVQQARNTGA